MYYQNEGYHLDCAVMGGHVYRGSQLPELYGWYVYADYCSGRVRAFDTSSPDSPSRVLVEAFDSEPAKFISAVEKTPEGELLFVSYFNQGFYRLERQDWVTAPPPTPTPTPTPTPNPTPTVDGFELVDSDINAPFAQMVDFKIISDSTDALVLIQQGYIHRVSLTDPNAEPVLFADMTDLVRLHHSEEGLLTLLFDPRYPEPPYVYIYYNAPKPDELTGFWYYDRLARFEVDLVNMVLDLESVEIILDLEDPIFHHNGGGPLGFGPFDGYLYLAYGDGGQWEEWNSQDNTNLFGTVSRIDVINPPPGEPYGIPPDNPFLDEPETLDEIFAYGFRNPWRGSIDPVTGTLWVGDVGHARWEEVNKVVPAGNYGWPIMEGYTCWQGLECEPPPDHVEPRAVYPIWGYPQCAITGGFVYRGTAMPELYGYFVYSDFCTGVVWALDTQDDEAPPHQAPGRAHGR